MARLDYDPLDCSSLLPFLMNKQSNDPCEFHTTRSTTVRYPASWANPRILSKTEYQEITRKGQLPKLLQQIFQKNLDQPCRVYFDIEANIAAISTYYEMAIINYESKYQRFSTGFSYHRETNMDIVPYFDIYVNDSDSVSYVSVTSKGTIKYSRDCFKVPSFDYQLQLSSVEQVTVVKLVRTEVACIGTSTGDSYMLFIKDNKFSIVDINQKIYSSTSLIRYYLQDYQFDFFSKSLNDYPLAKSEIIDISFVNEHFYITNKTNFTAWSLNNDKKFICVHNRRIMDDVIDRVTQHTPSNMNKTDIFCEIISVKFLLDEEFVVLASYKVPEMGDFIQYTVVKFYISYDQGHMESFVKYSNSIPCSVKQSSLARPPQLDVTSNLAFVSFEQSVVIVSLTRKSIYENYIALNDPNDEVLFLKVKEDTLNQTNTAYIFTASNGVLGVTVNIENIQSLSDKNIYAGLVYEIKDRDTKAFKSRLEQAVFFGTPDSLPLKFPFEAEKVDVAGAVLTTAEEIFNGTCKFLPQKTDFNLYVESRYYFLKRVYSAILDSIFCNQLEISDRITLLSLTAQSYFTAYFYKELSIRMNTDTGMHTIPYMIREIAGGNMDQLESPLIHDVASLKELLYNMIVSEPTHTCTDLIMDVIKATYCFEVKNIRIYGLESNEIKSVSEYLNSLLRPIFDSTLQEIIGSSRDAMGIDDTLEQIETAPSSTIERLEKVIALIKQTESITPNMDSRISHFSKTRKYMTEKLCLAGLHNMAANLAASHEDVGGLISCVYHCDPSSIKPRNNYYINFYGSKYFDLLVDYLLEQNRTEDAGELTALFPKLTQLYYENHAHARVSWIYFLKQKDYQRTLYALNCLLSQDITDGERLEATSWRALVSSAIAENKKAN